MNGGCRTRNRSEKVLICDFVENSKDFIQLYCYTWEFRGVKHVGRAVGSIENVFAVHEQELIDQTMMDVDDPILLDAETFVYRFLAYFVMIS